MKQKTITLKVSENTRKEMEEFFQDLKREKTPPYAVFQADDCDTVVTLYESGKAVFQGHDADLSSQFWIEREKHLNPLKKVETTDSSNNTKEKKETIKNPKLYNATTIGSDEVGTGDYFGPIIVTATYVEKENVPFLEELGIRDSKKMTDEKILEVVPLIIKKIPYNSVMLTNKEYNSNHDKYNMNKVKAILHNKMLYKTKMEHPNYEYIVVDQFAEKYVYFNYLKESSNVVRDITFLTKAEDQVLSVACASVISRYLFLKEYDKLSSELGFILPKGAGPIVDEVGKKIVQKFGKEKLNEVAKLSFKNTEKILNK